MKKLILFVTLAGLVVACSKSKDESTHCYACESFMYTKFQDGKEKFDTSTMVHCGKTQDWIDRWIRDYGTFDGPSWSVKPGEDTVKFYYRVHTECPIKK